jgi:hypothetical protein
VTAPRSARLPARVGAFAAAAELLERQPWEWQAEAIGVLSGVVGKPQAKLAPEVAPFVARQRADAAEAVLGAAAVLLRDAVRRAQLALKDPLSSHVEYANYGPVNGPAILAQVHPETAHLLALGPKRKLNAALKAAAERLPQGELWRCRQGWRSLGYRKPADAPAPARLGDTGPLVGGRRDGLPTRSQPSSEPSNVAGAGPNLS